MATTVTPATLTVSLAESITLNGHEHGSVNTFSVSSVTQVYKRIVSCPANAETTIAIFNSVVGAAGGSADFDAGLDVNDVRYIRVTNLDSSNSITLGLQIDENENDTVADETASILLGPGKSFLMGAAEDVIGISGTDALTSAMVTDLVDLESLVVQPGAANNDVEIFVASV